MTALLSCVYVVNANAQSGVAPIFVSPYQQQSTVTSRVPSIVQAQPTQQQRTYTQPGRKSYEIVTAKNPFEGTAFGRVRNEILIMDKETGQHLNQYDYMALMKQRGNIAELNRVAQQLQTNGVFDPAKYQAAINPQAAAPQGRVTQNGVVTPTPNTTTMSKSNFVYKGNNIPTTPQKLHGGYDDEAAPAPTPQQNKNAPIFLR